MKQQYTVVSYMFNVDPTSQNINHHLRRINISLKFAGPKLGMTGLSCPSRIYKKIANQLYLMLTQYGCSLAYLKTYT